jgi:hypothetical protein
VRWAGTDSYYTMFNLIVLEILDVSEWCAVWDGIRSCRGQSQGEAVEMMRCKFWSTLRKTASWFAS